MPTPLHSSHNKVATYTSMPCKSCCDFQAQEDVDGATPVSRAAFPPPPPDLVFVCLAFGQVSPWKTGLLNISTSSTNNSTTTFTLPFSCGKIKTVSRELLAPLVTLKFNELKIGNLSPEKLFHTVHLSRDCVCLTITDLGPTGSSFKNLISFIFVQSTRGMFGGQVSDTDQVP